MNEKNIDLSLPEHKMEQEKFPVLSIIMIRHGEALSKKDDPERHLTQEGIEYTKQTAEEIAARLGDPDKWMINQLDARNIRAKQSTEVFVNKLMERGFKQFFRPIKGTKDGQFIEKAEIADKPRAHTSVGSLAKKIMTKTVAEETTLMDFLKAKLKNEKNIEKPSEVDLLLAWAEEENLPEDIESLKDVKNLFLTAFTKQQEKLPQLADVLPSGKSVLTVIGLNNPRIDAAIEALTGVSLKESLQKGEEITPNSQGVKIDFYLNKPPEVSIVGRAETSLAQKDGSGKPMEKRKQIPPLASKLSAWVDPRALDSIKIEKKE
jgi:phosphohistidine phosphatase SixA